jgi:putative hemolysin
MLSILVVILVLMLSALFSGAEIAFVSASKLRVELNKSEGSKVGNIIAGFYDDAKGFIGTILVGNNIMLVIFTYLMTKFITPVLASIHDQYAFLLIVNTIIITSIVLIFGEFLPKTFFGLYANESLRIFAYPLLFFKKILSFPVWLTAGVSTILLKYVFKTNIEENQKIFTKIDLENFIKGASPTHEEEIDKELFENALHFNKLKVKECMVPRKEIIAIDIKEQVSTLEQIFKDSGVSRVLVYEEDIDNILGYIHHQSLLRNPKTLKNAMMTLPIVPEVMSIYEVLNFFIKDRNSIAWVVDEYGGTAGVITMEDILEELFGNIEDEHDQEEYIEIQVNENEFVFSGRLEISYLNEKYPGLNLPEGEYTTLSGYIVMTTETIPEQGTEIVLDNFKFNLETVSETKIETVRVVKLTDPE